MTLFLLAIIFRVVNIQYAQGAKYKKLATELTIKQDTIKANKGNVYAADGNLLATSMSKYTIRMDVVAVNSNVFENNFMALSEELFQMKPYQFKSSPKKKSNHLVLAIRRN